MDSREEGRMPAKGTGATGRGASPESGKPFDKYYYYSLSVQSPDEDMDFIDAAYADLHGAKAKPKTLREDFCGTFANSCAWVRRGDERVAHGVDLDPEPIGYGREHYLVKLTPAQQKRVHLHEANVLSPSLPHVDAIAAPNFSYFIFKDRPTLKQYFANCLATLEKGGILVLDCFGGSACQEANEEETEFEVEQFSYFWDQMNFDPVNNHALFHIHFQRVGEPKRTEQFTYDWRMWSVPELRDLLTEVGFREVRTYWEGTDEDGEGNGEFELATQGEECESWVSYIVAVK
jgi:hypothetical protein